MNQRYEADEKLISDNYNTNYKANKELLSFYVKSELENYGVTGVSGAEYDSISSSILNAYRSNVSYYEDPSYGYARAKTAVRDILSSKGITKPAATTDTDWEKMVIHLMDDFLKYGKEAAKITNDYNNNIKANNDKYVAEAKRQMVGALTTNVDKASMTMSYGIKPNSSLENVQNIKVNPPMKKLDIQAGADGDLSNIISIEWEPLNVSILAMTSTNVLSADSATVAITSVKSAMQIIANQRSYFGAMQNRMEHTIRNLDNVVENTTAAESRIRDTQMDEEMVAFSNQSIIQQAGQAMLAQANQSKQGVLTMLQ